MENLLQVGVITSTHGLKGEVKVFPTTDDKNRFKDLKEVILDTGKEKLDIEIQGVKFFKQFVILKFKGIDDINDVEKYKKSSLLVSRENAVKLDEGEYFISDLIGLKVVTDDDTDLGILIEVLFTGANDVYVVEGQDKKEILLPAIKECILNVDIDKGIMQVHIMEGLLD
ncbi:MAG: ribosome maturation factor RimM [Clostridiales bacterium]|nr:ribosome maturation factor RimM [Clostridiales bacterium]